MSLCIFRLAVLLQADPHKAVKEKKLMNSVKPQEEAESVKAPSFRRYNSISSRTGLLCSMAVRLTAAWLVVNAALSPACAADSESGTESDLDEVVVTAERHNSTIQETPISISALSGEQLAAQGITDVEELAHDVPGVSMRSAGPGQSEYEARGLASTGGAAPTVGFYLNDIPLSPPSAAQVGKVVIDPDLYDIDHVEVLRGPQGTLYGSGSMGGTIRVVTNQPKLDSYQGSIAASASGTVGGGPNGDVNAMVNIPLGDNMALRVVATQKYRDGWIDRIVVNPFPADSLTRGNVVAAPVQSIAKDVNTEMLTGARASLLLKASDDLTFVADVLFQDIRMGGYDEFDSPPGSAYLAHYEAFPIKEPIFDKVTIGSLTAKDDLHFATLTSVTAFWNREEQQTQDASENMAYTLGIPTIVPVPYSETDYTHQFSEEIRLSSPEESNRVRWTVGTFYSDLHSLWAENSANDSPEVTSLANGANPLGIELDTWNPYRIQQFAVFGDGSVNITDTLKFSTGLRWFDYKSSVDNYEWGALFSGAGIYAKPATPITFKTSDSGFTPRFDLSYSPNKELTTYISASEGYRPGGLNQEVPTALCGAAPTSFRPDSVWDYEIGEKAKLFDNRLTINSDIFYIKWNQVQQILLLTCGFETNNNAGQARSFGPEIEVNARLTPELSVTANGNYTNAEINKPIPGLASSYIGYVSSCQSATKCTIPILNVPKYAGSVSLLYSRPVFHDYELTARLTDSYVGPVIDEAYYPIIHLPSYNLLNLRVGFSADKWSAGIFANNLTNTRAQITANNTSFQFNIPAYYRISTNQPLTIGVNFARHF